MDQRPALLRDRLRFTRREQLVKHWIETVRHRADQADQRFGIDGIQGLPSRRLAQGVVATPFPQLNTVGKLVFEAHLMAGPEHGLTAIEVEGLDREQEQIKAFDTPTA